MWVLFIIIVLMFHLLRISFLIPLYVVCEYVFIQLVSVIKFIYDFNSRIKCLQFICVTCWKNNIFHQSGGARPLFVQQVLTREGCTGYSHSLEIPGYYHSLVLALGTIIPQSSVLRTRTSDLLLKRFLDKSLRHLSIGHAHQVVSLKSLLLVVSTTSVVQFCSFLTQ